MLGFAEQVANKINENMVAPGAAEQKPGDKKPVQPAKPAAAAQPAEKKPVEAAKPDANEQKKPETNQPAPEKKAAPEGPTELQKIFKEKYNLDLPDDEILARVQGKPASGKKPEPVKPEPATEDEIIGEFKRKGKSQDDYNRARQIADTKDDFALVMLSTKMDLLKENPNLTDAQITEALQHQFFISDDAELYQPYEKRLGEQRLKAAADHIRKMETGELDEVTSTLNSQKRAAAAMQAHSAEVEEYVSRTPSKVTFDIGKMGEKDLGTFDLEVLPETKAEISKLMKDPMSFVNLFADPEGNIDLSKFYDMLVHFKLRTISNKTLANFYHSRGLEEAQAGFVNNPPVNGNASVVGDEHQNKKKEAEQHNKNQINKRFGGK